MEVSRVRTWSSLFLQNRAAARTRNLKHFTLQEVNGVTIVPMDLIMQGCTEWSEYVVGFFIEQCLSFTYVKNVLQQRWKDKGHFEIIADNDLFYFKFSSSEARQAVLEEGPIFIGGRCLIISPWTRGVEKQRTLITIVPLWVKIHNVLKELWTDDGLGFLASKGGVPHSQDEATKLKKRIDYARVCVEVDVSAKLPDSFPIELALGDERLISFEYPWIPARCESCQKFGHATENCFREANLVRRMNINGTGRVNIRTNVQTGRNTVIYAGNGTGENERRRIWRVRNRPTSLSEVAGPSCIRNDRGEETKEHNSCPAAQGEPAEIPIDAGQSELTKDRTQMTEVTIDMHDSMQMVMHEPQVEELVLVVQPNPFQLLAREELEGESPHETEYFEDHLYAYEKEVEQKKDLADIYRAFICATVHEIWAERNRRRFQSVPHLQAKELVELIVKDTRLYLQAKIKDIVSTFEIKQLLQTLRLQVNLKENTEIPCYWTKPDEGVVKLNTDGVVNSRGASPGGIIRDNHRDIVVAYIYRQ
ncbi:hypothetical protein IFM89_031422 [Coptis chinensis]|uniref:DUF4283 domain-containing protein n=1 Tax=Coptis chinensis TaxID=261450 RepID=A0A835HG53_9MAGN|nr:hypothetical protein IFM89_031422 [Coptis chinensis]